MKKKVNLKYIANNLIKTDNNKTDIDPETIINAVNIHNYNYDWGKFQERLEAYFFTCWYCTDTWVGEKIYYLDGKPVAYSSQEGRKSSENIYFFSQKCAEKVKKFAESCLYDNNEFQIIDPKEDYGEPYFEIDYASQFITGVTNLNGATVEKRDVILDRQKDHRKWDCNIILSADKEEFEANEIQFKIFVKGV